MKSIVECVPNFSEGRRAHVVNALAEAIGSVPGVHVIDRQIDSSHNRSVITFIASPEALAEGVLRGARIAKEHIDLRQHQGEHPRMGAMDVCPLIPLQGIDESQCIQLSEEVARRLWEELQIPVYFYESAARHSSRKNLAAIRNLGFERLSKTAHQDPNLAPDVGGPKLHETAGAIAVGVRAPLVAFNVNLTTQDVAVAKKIAHAIRERDGGLKGVKALGFFIRERNAAQVSMNLTDVNATGLHRAYEAVKLEASRFGVGVQESEIVGLVPEKALFEAAAWELQLHHFSPAFVLENRVRAVLEESPPSTHETPQPVATDSTQNTSEKEDESSEATRCLRAAMKSAILGCDLFCGAGQFMTLDEDAQKAIEAIDRAKSAVAALGERVDESTAAKKITTTDELTVAKTAMAHVADALVAGLTLVNEATKNHSAEIGVGVLELSTALSSLSLAIEGALRAGNVLGRARNQQRRQMSGHLARGRDAATAMEVKIQALFVD